MGKSVQLGGGINPYIYVSANPLRNYDEFGLTQKDVEIAKAIAAETQADLGFPEQYAYGATSPAGITDVLGKRTVLNDIYLGNLSDWWACDLLNTLIHGAIHLTYPNSDHEHQDDFDSCGKGFPQREADRRTTPTLCKRLNKLRKGR